MDLQSDLVQVRSCSAGGGRGVFAKVDIQPGTLLLLEQPLLRVPTDKHDKETLHMALARGLLQHAERDRLLAGTAQLHPVKLTDLPAHTLASLSSQLKADVSTLRSIQEEHFKQHTASNLDDEALLRLLLVLRFNAHPSGLYLLSEMVNHRCNPNAIKLATPRGSELRAVRLIAAEEEVTISYLDPPLQSLSRRCALLEAQHFFQPSTSDFPWDMEAWAPEVSGSLKECDCTEQLLHLEEQLDGLERQAHAACATLQKQAARLAKQARRQGRPASNSSAGQAGVTPADATEDSSAVEDKQPQDPVAQLASQTCAAQRAAASLLHPRHIVLARIYELLITLLSSLLTAYTETAGPKQARSPPSAPTQPISQRLSWLPHGLDLSITTPPTPSTQPAPTPDTAAQSALTTQSAATAAAKKSVNDINAASTPVAQTSVVPEPAQLTLLLLRACAELRLIQELYAGPSHYDAARTLLDMQNAMEYMLTHYPKILYAHSQWINFAKASRAAYQCRQEHRRIADMYR